MENAVPQKTYVHQWLAGTISEHIFDFHKWDRCDIHPEWRSQDAAEDSVRPRTGLQDNDDISAGAEKPWCT